MIGFLYPKFICLLSRQGEEERSRWPQLGREWGVMCGEDGWVGALWRQDIQKVGEKQWTCTLFKDALLLNLDTKCPLYDFTGSSALVPERFILSCFASWLHCIQIAIIFYLDWIPKCHSCPSSILYPLNSQEGTFKSSNQAPLLEIIQSPSHLELNADSSPWCSGPVGPAPLPNEVWHFSLEKDITKWVYVA